MLAYVYIYTYVHARKGKRTKMHENAKRVLCVGRLSILTQTFRSKTSGCTMHNLLCIPCRFSKKHMLLAVL